VRFWRGSGWVSFSTSSSVDRCSFWVDDGVRVVSLVTGRAGRPPGFGFLRRLVSSSDGYRWEFVGLLFG